MSVLSSTINILFQNRCCSLVRVLYASCFCMSKKENYPDPGTAAIICSSACLTGIDQTLFTGSTSKSTSIPPSDITENSKVRTRQRYTLSRHTSLEPNLSPYFLVE